MERYLQNASATLEVAFEVDGVPTDPVPASATVEILRDDGSVLVSAGTATIRTGTGRFAYPLTPSMTALLDIFTVRWTSSLGTITTRAEIVGGFFFSLSEFKAIGLGGSKTIGSTYSDADLLDMRTLVEDTIEQATGRAFVPRYKRRTIRRGPYSASLDLGYLDVRAVRWITVAGTAVSPSEITALTFDDLGFVTGLGVSYYYASGAFIVGFEYGMDEPPPRVRAAALLLAHTWIVKGPIDDRVTTMSSPDTGITAVLSTPGRGGSVVGIPEVDQVIREYQVPAFA